MAREQIWQPTASRSRHELTPDDDLAQTVARLMTRLERFESDIALEREVLMRSLGGTGDTGGHADRIGESVGAMIGEVLQVLEELHQLSGPATPHRQATVSQRRERVSHRPLPRRRR